MPVETADYIKELKPQYPTGGESISDGDDHLRTIKGAVLGSFPEIDSPVTSTPAQLNAVGQTAVDVEQLRSEFDELDVSAHGNVASCYWNPVFDTPLAYSHNVNSVIADPSDSSGLQTRVVFAPNTMDGDPHYAFNLTPVNGTGRPTVITVVGVAQGFLAFLSWQLIDETWTPIPGTELSFSLSVNDMASGQ